jgi:hypothetical protein
MNTKCYQCGKYRTCNLHHDIPLCLTCQPPEMKVYEADKVEVTVAGVKCEPAQGSYVELRQKKPPTREQLNKFIQDVHAELPLWIYQGLLR